MKYGNRSMWQRFISSPFSAVALVIVVFVLARAGLNINDKVKTSSARLESAQANLAKLTDRQADLSDKVGYLSTDQGLEAEIRTKYHAVREGEKVAVIVDGDQPANAFAASSTTATSSPGFWGRILRAVGF